MHALALLSSPGPACQADCAGGGVGAETVVAAGKQG
jgi:hypothetical protein